MTIVMKKPVIAVAGSSGKTTTKEMIAAILKQRWPIFKSPANRNNRQNIRQHLKRIKPHHRAVVLEFGMSGPGHLAQSCRIIKPNMAVITMVGTAHIGNFGGSLPNLIRAKSGIIKHMQSKGTLFLNADDKNSQRLSAKNFRGKIVKIGVYNQAKYKAEQIAYTDRGMTFQVQLNEQAHNFFIPIYGNHNVYNALFAIAVSHQLGFSPHEIKAGLKKYHRPPHRLRVYKLKGNMKLIDDTFNANPHSVKAALDVLTAVSKKNNVAVLGSMGELGRYSRQGHTIVGKYAAGKSNLNRIYTYGQGARQIGRAAVKAGFPGNNAIHAVKRKTLHQHLKKELQPGCTVLVKGSNMMGMYKTVKFLRQT